MFIPIRSTIAVALVTLFAVPSAQAANMVANGGFEITTLTNSGQFTTEIANWSNSRTTGYTGYGYNFLIKSGTADTTGFTSFGGNLDRLWGPNSGSANGLTASSPTGGNYIAADGDTNFAGAISQTISLLAVGSRYQLTFDWAGAQFAGYNGATTEAWQVTFGNDVKVTNTVSNASRGFTGWQSASMSFVATSATQVLSFLAQGTPNGEPPTLLLDNVSLDKVAVPEPASMALLATGLAGLGMITRRRRVAASR